MRRSPESNTVSRGEMLLHRTKVRVHQAARLLAERGGPEPGIRSERLAGAPVLASHDSVLWRDEDPREWILQAGKVHNLRVAAAAFDGIELAAGQVFSFWSHLGRPTRRRGFVAGRELREGCVVPSVAGGICQLSNALYAAALDAGLTIVERHAHSRVLPGSAAEAERDATVLWNYVDLRFVAGFALRIEVELTRDRLRVRLRGHPARRGVSRGRPALSVLDSGVTDGSRSRGGRPALSVLDSGDARSCLSCDNLECSEYAPSEARAGERAFLVDGLWPELDAYVHREARRGDHLRLPFDGARWGRPRYAWCSGAFERARVEAFPRLTLARAVASRRLAEQGAPRQRALLDMDARMAEAMAASLPPEVTEVVVAQNLLPHLWRGGHLGGRRFSVLATRFSIASLQARLDAAAVRHPGSSTIADFRADPDLVAAEQEALRAADRIVTPHSAIADEHGDRAEHLPWTLPSQPPVARPMAHRVRFVASTVARKGCYELREALRGTEIELVTTGSMLEGPDFWAGQRRGSEGPVDAVVLPAWVEHAPRRVLAAVAAGIPAVVSTACGLRGVPGVREVAPGDVEALREAILAAVDPSREARHAHGG